MNVRSLFRLLLCFPGFWVIAPAPAASANSVIITVHAHIDEETPAGGPLSPGQDLTFTFVSMPTVLLPVANSDAANSTWLYNAGMGSPIWSDVSFFGQTGSWTDATDAADGVSVISIDRSPDEADIDTILLIAGNPYGTGIFTNDTEILLIRLQLAFSAFTLPANESPFAGTLDQLIPSGNPASQGESYGAIYLDGIGEEIGFTVDSASFAIVPEPTGPLLGFTALGLALTRRRRPHP